MVESLVRPEDRGFLDLPLPGDLLQSLLSAAHNAPSASFTAALELESIVEAGEGKWVPLRTVVRDDTYGEEAAS